MPKTGRRVLWIGSALSAGLLILLLSQVDVVERAIPIPSGWQPSFHLDLRLTPHGPSAGTHAAVREAIRPCDLLRTTLLSSPCYNRELEVMIFRLERPGGTEVFFGCTNSLLLAAVLASVLIPFLLCVVIAIEVEALERRG
jgi:hypothetical protein